MEQLASLPDQSVQMVVTSPPFWGLRDYGLPASVWGGDMACKHSWQSQRYYREGGNSAGSALAFSSPGPDNAQRLRSTRWHEDEVCTVCGAWKGCLGLEPTPALYIEHLVDVFGAVWRVLRDDGTLWLNLGDCYESGTRATRDYSKTTKHGYWNNPNINRRVSAGLKAKNLLLLPHRVAIALQAAGWRVRQDIVWAKPNPMPESTKDRPTRAHEYLFLMSKSTRYYYDADSIREPHTSTGKVTPWREREYDQSMLAHGQANGKKGRPQGVAGFAAGGRNKRSVWTIATQPFKGAHFATFPEALVRPCVLAGSRPGDTVLDPFAGSGRTLIVAESLGRNAIGIELQQGYCRMIRTALGGEKVSAGR